MITIPTIVRTVDAYGEEFVANWASNDRMGYAFWVEEPVRGVDDGMFYINKASNSGEHGFACVSEEVAKELLGGYTVQEGQCLRLVEREMSFEILEVMPSS